MPDIINVATNTTLNAKINKVKGKVPSITDIITTAVLNAKINQFKFRIPNTTNLSTTAALIAVENKVPIICNLDRKNDDNTKVS